MPHIFGFVPVSTRHASISLRATAPHSHSSELCTMAFVPQHHYATFLRIKSEENTYVYQLQLVSNSCTQIFFGRKAETAQSDFYSKLLGKFLCHQYSAVFPPTNKMYFICSNEKMVNLTIYCPTFFTFTPPHNANAQLCTIKYIEYNSW